LAQTCRLSLWLRLRQEWKSNGNRTVINRAFCCIVPEKEIRLSRMEIEWKCGMEINGYLLAIQEVIKSS